MSLEILRNYCAKSKLTRAFETCQESGRDGDRSAGKGTCPLRSGDRGTESPLKERRAGAVAGSVEAARFLGGHLSDPSFQIKSLPGRNRAHCTRVARLALAACSSALRWPIVFLEVFVAGAVQPVLSKGEGRICKAQFSVRNATCRKPSARVTATAATARASRVSDSAWMANTTARIAGKLVKSAWLNLVPNPMADEPVRVVFHLDQDWRLVGVFCCAV